MWAWTHSIVRSLRTLTMRAKVQPGLTRRWKQFRKSGLGTTKILGKHLADPGGDRAMLEADLADPKRAPANPVSMPAEAAE